MNWAKECNSMLTSATGEETLTPNPNECNSTLTSGTKGIYPNRYILMLMSGVTAYVFSTLAGELLIAITKTYSLQRAVKSDFPYIFKF